MAGTKILILSLEVVADAKGIIPVSNCFGRDRSSGGQSDLTMKAPLNFCGWLRTFLELNENFRPQFAMSQTEVARDGCRNTNISIQRLFNHLRVDDSGTDWQSLVFSA